MTRASLDSVEAIRERFDEHGYVAGDALATSVFLVLKLGRPLLLEGAAGVGKTQLAQVLAEALGTRLIRLQCYEGLDVHSAMYEWDYQRQLLAIRLQDAEQRSLEEKEAHIFSKDFLLERPLLQAITEKEAPPVLLIDEVDRADEAFEAFLLELLSQFQITIPEFGTIKATHTPHVILTSNRTRDLSDALKRRCLFHWIDYPDFDKELTIVRKQIHHIEVDLARQIVRFVQLVRQQRLAKPPGIAETLDWANALIALGKNSLDADVLRTTAGALLKSSEDQELLEQIGFDGLLAES